MPVEWNSVRLLQALHWRQMTSNLYDRGATSVLPLHLMYIALVIVKFRVDNYFLSRTVEHVYGNVAHSFYLICFSGRNHPPEHDNM